MKSDEVFVPNKVGVALKVGGVVADEDDARNVVWINNDPLPMQSNGYVFDGVRVHLEAFGGLQSNELDLD